MGDEHLPTMRPTVFALARCLLLIGVYIAPSSGQSGENYTDVLNDIVKVSPRVRPVKDPTTFTNISVSFHLLSIVQFDFVEQRLVSNAWFTVEWHNEYTQWDLSAYDNASLVFPDPATVWRPSIAVQNTMKELKPLGSDFVLIVSMYNGDTLWYPGERLETFCQARVAYFPFDIQTCEYVVFNWGGTNEQHFVPSEDEIDLSYYTVNAEWELVRTRAWLQTHQIDTEVDTYLHFSVTLRRRPALPFLTVLLPVIVLATANVFVFTIPSESGERLSYSMTALLSFGVFMNFIVDLMPSSTEDLSIVAINMSILLVLSAVYVLLCILSLRLFHRDSSKHPVPGLLQTVVVWLELIVCLDPPSKTNKVDVVNFQKEMDLAQPKVKESQDNLSSLSTMSSTSSLKGLKLRMEKYAKLKRKIHAAHSDPDEMTWQRVSRTVDKLLFRFFFLFIVTQNVVVISLLLNNYYTEV